jgi:hypothetical protein
VFAFSLFFLFFGGVFVLLAVSSHELSSLDFEIGIPDPAFMFLQLISALNSSSPSMT